MVQRISLYFCVYVRTFLEGVLSEAEWLGHSGDRFKFLVGPAEFPSKTCQLLSRPAVVCVSHSGHYWACSLLLIRRATLDSICLSLLLVKLSIFSNVSWPLNLASWFFIEKRFNLSSYIVSSRKCSFCSREYMEALASCTAQEFLTSYRESDYSFQHQQT